MPAGGTSSSPVLDLVIPGAQKAGTSTLIDLLGRHSHVTRHETPEYSTLMNKSADLDRAVQVDFVGAEDGTLLAAKSAGVLHSPWAIAKIVQHNPNVRFLVILRDPARRAYSAYLYAVRIGEEHCSDFQRAWALQDDESQGRDQRSFFLDYRRRSEYLMPLRLLRDHVGPDNVGVVTLEELRQRQAHTLDTITSWLGIPQFAQNLPEQWSNSAAVSHSPSLARLLRSDSAAKSLARRLVPIGARRAAFRALDQVNRREKVLDPISYQDYQKVSEEFMEHNRQLEAEFGVNTSYWTFE